MKSMCSHSSSSVLFVMIVMALHSLSYSCKVMTALIACVIFNLLLWSFLCNLINISAMGGGGANQWRVREITLDMMSSVKCWKNMICFHKASLLWPSTLYWSDLHIQDNFPSCNAICISERNQQDFFGCDRAWWLSNLYWPEWASARVALSLPWTESYFRVYVKFLV